MTRNTILCSALLASAALAQQPRGGPRPAGAPSRPTLVVVIVVDQLRADLLTRCADLFLPGRVGKEVGGFRYLMDEGAWFVNARFTHAPLLTGPGHAVISTGAPPSRTGIIGNLWWDPIQRLPVYCVQDISATVIGAAPESNARPMGPRLLRSTTVGDELKLATAGRAKVVSLSIKDRSAILLGGHTQDACVWYDTAGGRWITSSAFGQALPAWAEAVNQERMPDRSLGAEWAPSLDAGILAERSRPSTVVPPYLGAFGGAFPHGLPKEPGRGFYHSFIYTPAANEFVLHTALSAVQGEGLGRDSVPDILSISLSTNDYVGHAFGPYSPEAIDITVQTDRALSAFFTALDSALRGGIDSAAIVLTADHGVSPVPEDPERSGLSLPAGRFAVRDVLGAIESALSARFGAPAGGSWFSQAQDPRAAGGSWIDGFIWLSEGAVMTAVSSGKAADRRTIEQAACDAVAQARIDGVYACYGKQQILEGRIGDPALRDRLARAVYPSISADLVVIPDQLHLADPDPERHATTHGSPYIYDTHVPVLIAAPGRIRPGVSAEAVSPADIAPTLSLMLGIEMPSGCEGTPLPALIAPSGRPGAP